MVSSIEERGLRKFITRSRPRNFLALSVAGLLALVATNLFFLFRRSFTTYTLILDVVVNVIIIQVVLELFSFFRVRSQIERDRSKYDEPHKWLRTWRDGFAHPLNESFSLFLSGFVICEGIGAALLLLAFEESPTDHWIFNKTLVLLFLIIGGLSSLLGLILLFGSWRCLINRSIRVCLKDNPFVIGEKCECKIVFGDSKIAKQNVLLNITCITRDGEIFEQTDRVDLNSGEVLAGIEIPAGLPSTSFDSPEVMWILGIRSTTKNTICSDFLIPVTAGGPHHRQSSTCNGEVNDHSCRIPKTTDISS